MRAIIGAKLLGSNLAEPAPKPFEICDTRLPVSRCGFDLRAFDLITLESDAITESPSARSESYCRRKHANGVRRFWGTSHMVVHRHSVSMDSTGPR